VLESVGERTDATTPTGETPSKSYGREVEEMLELDGRVAFVVPFGTRLQCPDPYLQL
jgi:hypothetical protein